MPPPARPPPPKRPHPPSRPAVPSAATSALVDLRTLPPEFAPQSAYTYKYTFASQTDGQGRKVTTYTYVVTPSSAPPYTRTKEIVEEGNVGSKPSVSPEALCAAQASGPCNAPVLAWAVSQSGTKVGRGLCSDVGDGAIAAAHAARPGRDAHGAPMWGTAVDFDNAAPGDVVQFWDCRFEGTQKGTTYWEVRGRPEDSFMHTAIVLANHGTKVLEVLEQNISSSPVISTRLDFKDLIRGEVAIYRLKSQ